MVQTCTSSNGAQVKGRFAPDGHYYDKDSGALVTNRFVHIYNWNFQNQDGNRVLKFMLTIPNDSAIGSDGKSHFIDMSHYPLSSNDLDREDYYYYVDAKGNKLTGPQTLNGIHVYFDQMVDNLEVSSNLTKMVPFIITMQKTVHALKIPLSEPTLVLSNSMQMVMDI